MIQNLSNSEYVKTNNSKLKTNQASTEVQRWKNEFTNCNTETHICCSPERRKEDSI